MYHCQPRSRGGQEEVDKQIPEQGQIEGNSETTLKEYWKLYFDGASKTKTSGAGLVLQSPEAFIVEYALKIYFPTTNNETEYEALIAGIGLDYSLRAKNIKIRGDSRLIVSQVNGDYEAKEEMMKEYLKFVKALIIQFEECHIEHIPREENMKADNLSKYASSKIKNYTGTVYYEVLKTPTIQRKLVAPISQGSCWMDQINAHLRTWWLPTYKMEARKIYVKSLRYALIEGVLYKKSFLIPYLKCLRPQEAETALREVHEGICGQNQGGRALAHKLTRLGFY